MNAQFYNKKHKNKKKRVYRFRPSSTVDTFLSFVVHDFCEQRQRLKKPIGKLAKSETKNSNIPFKHANLLVNRLVSPFPITVPTPSPAPLSTWLVPTAMRLCWGCW